MMRSSGIKCKTVPAVVLEATQTSIQELLNSVGQEESSRGHDGFCK